MVLLLSDADVGRAISMAEAIEQLETAFQQHAAGTAIVSPRTSAKVPGDGGMFRVMSAILPNEGFFGLKTLTGYPGRRASGETYFVILLFSCKDGALRAIMGANRLTGIRTGAATGLASKYLARPETRVVGLFGAGVQGWYQIAALKEVHPVREIRVFDLDHAKAASFAAQVAREFQVEAIAVREPREAVSGCDSVVTATAASSPVFKGEWLDPGTHVSAVGSNAPSKCEIDALTFKLSKIAVDFRDQVLEEAGDLRAAIESKAISAGDIHADLAEVITGLKRRRDNSEEITLFKSVGMAIEDISTASYVYRRAVSLGIGTNILLEDASAATSVAAVSTPLATAVHT